MNVVGSASNTPSPMSAIFAARAFHFAWFFNVTSIAARELVDHLEPDVVPRVSYSRPGLPRPTISFKPTLVPNP